MRLIDANTLVGKDGLFGKRGCPGNCQYCGLWSKEGCRVILEAPTVDAVEVVHGWWENITDYGGGNCFGYCSNCRMPIKSNNRTALLMDNRYCRYCGAKMDGDKDDN